MNLSGQEASKYVVFTDEFDPHIGAGSIDIRILEDVFLAKGYEGTDYDHIKPYAFVSSIERVELDNTVSALLVLRSSMFRMGVGLASTGYIDPGFRGHLAFRLHLLTDDEVRLSRGDRVAQLIFFRMENNDQVYAGKYQDSEGKVGFISDE